MSAFDFIVVGAGSAGAPLAARLSENPTTRVLLLEAGPNYRSADTPKEIRRGPFADIVRRGGFHWPDLYASITESRTPSLYLRGFGVGGSSAINATAAMRGVPADYDEWGAYGASGWSWNDVLPRFVRLEDDRRFADRPYHGRGGPVPIERGARDGWGPVSRTFADAALACGYPWCEDINAPGAAGIYPAPCNCDGGVRVSTNDAYLEPARERPNLSIRGGSTVERVEFNGARAVGVRARFSGRSEVIEGGEVILCAGAIHSPAILMRSGIGPANQLRSLGIAPLIDRPGVGENLCEHPLVELRLGLRIGAISGPFGCGLRTGSGPESANDVLMYASDVGEGAIGVAMVKPYSRGRLQLKSRDPAVQPEIHFRLLSQPRDLERLRIAVRAAHRIVTHRAFAPAGAAVSPPGLTDAVRTDDSALDQFLRDNCEEFFHAMGTCRMGALDDPLAVVDSDCRVIGADCLRVADASIIPTPPSAPTHLTAVMIGEVAADRLRAGSRSSA